MWVLYPYLLVRTTIKDLHLKKNSWLLVFYHTLLLINCATTPSAGRYKAEGAFLWSKFNLAVLFSDIVPTQVSIGPEYFGTIL